MKSYEDWAREVVTKTGTIGAKQVIVEMQKLINSLEGGLDSKTRSTDSSTSSLSHQISSVERGNVTYR